MKYAWQDPQGTLRDIADSDPYSLFHPDVAALYDTEVDDGVTRGATLVDGVWVNPVVYVPTQEDLDAAEALRLEAEAIQLAAQLEAMKPKEVTMRQARLALLGAGKLVAVNAAIAAMPGAPGEAARIEWEFSSTVKRQSVLIAQLAGGLGLTTSDLDDLFALANTL